MKKNLLIVLSLFLIIGTFPTYSSASTSKPVISDGEIIEVNITEENFKIALEIAQSDLESSVIVGSNGKFETTFTNHKEANVSKKTFDTFLETLNLFNKALEEGELYIENPNLGLDGIGIPDFQIQEGGQDNVITPMFTVIGKNYYKLTNLDVSRVNKVIRLGGNAAALASALGVSLGVGAAVFAAVQMLGGVLDFCNWYNKGVYITKVGRTWTCFPVPR